jgi:hypothetical protein
MAAALCAANDKLSCRAESAAPTRLIEKAKAAEAGPYAVNSSALLAVPTISHFRTYIV